MKIEQNNFKVQPNGFATKALHTSQNLEQPIFLSSTYKQDGLGENKVFVNSRSENSSRDMLEKVLASLANGKHGLTFTSATTVTRVICSLLKTGDHLICCDDVYGGTDELFRQITSHMGVECEFVDATNLRSLKNAIKSNTKMMWLESPTNPTMKVIDIQGASDIAHEQGEIIVVVDNTFLSSYFQRPLELDADICMYSVTKYMNGHSDVVMGAAIVNNDQLHEKLRFLQEAMGVVPSPFDCYLVNRSLKTLALRMERHNKTSLEIAKYLEKHASVEKVLHPGLPSHPQHELALRQCYGHSGMLTFYLKGGLNESRKFVQALKIFTYATSLGGSESLAQSSTELNQVTVLIQQRIKPGVADNLVRLSVGLEDVEDLIEDLAQALKKSQS